MPKLPRRALLPALLLLLGGCGGGPDYVFIPADTYQQGLTARADLPASGVLAPGEWATLHANRIMGPWVKVRREEVPKGVKCTRRIAPTSPDLEIASKLRWEVLPVGSVKFNMPEAPDYERRIQFSAPGEYRLWAVSDAPCGGEFASDTIVVTVR